MEEALGDGVADATTWLSHAAVHAVLIEASLVLGAEVASPVGVMNEPCSRLTAFDGAIEGL